MRYRPEDLRSVPIDDLATALGLATRRTGASTVTRCTNSAHDDRHPSMSLDTRRNRFKCFSCGNSGTPVDLVMQVLALDFPAAADWVGRAFGLSDTRTAVPFVAPRASRPPRTFPKASVLPALVPSPQAIEVLEALLVHLGPLRATGAAYLASRGVSSKTAAAARVGFLATPRETDRFLTSSFSPEALVASGLYAPADPAKKRPIRFRFFQHPLLFPLLLKGRPTFLQGRRLDGDTRPKYLSTGGSIPAPYNVDLLQDLKPGARVLIAEGPIDTLTLVEHGYPAIGIFGVENFKPEWVSLLSHLEVFLALDSDAAGKRGTEKLAALFSATGKRVRFVPLPENTDVNDFFLRGASTR